MKNNRLSIFLIIASAITIGVFTTLTITGQDSYKIRKITKSANTYLSNGDYDNAIASFNALLDLDINSKDAYMGLVAANIQNGDYQETEEIVEMAKAVLGDDFTNDDELTVHEMIVASHEHNYTEATCLQPEICSICNETGADALGHDFANADCVTPKTCSRCGETEGKPLGHDFDEASYWVAKTCKICGATEGEPLPGAFAQHGLACVDAVDATVEGNLKDHNIPFVVTMSDYKCFDGDDSHEPKDGYVWQQITMDIVMKLEADSWTYRHTAGWEDYYDPALADDSAVREKDGSYKYTVNYMDNKYEDCIRRMDVILDDYYPAQDGVPGPSRAVARLLYSFRVPKGYDGTVVTFCNNSDPWAPGTYIYDNADGETFFRLPAANNLFAQ